MKKIIIIAAAIAMTMRVNAQDIPASSVPSVVLNALQTKFTNITDLEWEKEGELFKADFEIGNRDHKVWIDKTGVITKHKQDIPKKDLPVAIKQAIENDFKAFRIDDADKIEKDGNTVYEVELDGNGEDRKVTFSADGKIFENRID